MKSIEKPLKRFNTIFMKLVLIILSCISGQVFAAQPKPWQMMFQDPASPVMEAIKSLHDHLLLMIMIVAIIVAALLMYVIFRFRAHKNPTPSKTTHHNLLEFVWTAIPLVILIIITIPSVKLLYFLDKPTDPELTIKAIGHQWYWSYEYPLAEGGEVLSFDSYIIEDKDLKPGQLRLLDVDQPVIIPINKTVRVLITSTDVLHSFAVPSLGIKSDAVPGRVNETWFRISKPGMYYGQCSELCGTKHGFMPIAIHAVEQSAYDDWLKEKQQKG